MIQWPAGHLNRVNKMVPMTQSSSQVISARDINIHTRDVDLVEWLQLSSEGPWICGGAVIQWINGRPVNGHDIDVWCANYQQIADVHENIRSLIAIRTGINVNAVVPKATSEHATTYWVPRHAATCHAQHHTQLQLG